MARKSKAIVAALNARWGKGNWGKGKKKRSKKRTTKRTAKKAGRKRRADAGRKRGAYCILSKSDLEKIVRGVVRK